MYKLVCLVVLGACLLVSPELSAQKKKKKGKNSEVAGVKTEEPKSKSSAPKPYNQVITSKAKTQKGLFTVHHQDNDYFFEIPDSVLGREFLAVTRISRAPTGAGYGGEEQNRQVLRWEKGPNNKMFLRVALFVNASGDTTKPISQAVRNSNLEPIAAAFDIKAFKDGGGASVINVTDFFSGDNQLIALEPAVKQRYYLTGLQKDLSYIDNIKTYPINTEIRMVKTFGVNIPPPSSRTNPTNQNVILPAGDKAGVVTMELNCSMILLPQVPARRRFFDNRIGYFANGYTVYGENSQRAETEVFIIRWRLEPKPEDIEKMKKGELVEPKKPIVFYIDPATPVKWRKYLIQGVQDWQKAFEQAGFKNAILAKEVPEGDSTISTEDARYSFIRYFASDVQNAYGPNVHDPRTGEILESHIGWYHNVMRLLNNWYAIQAAAIDPRARKPQLDDELMGELIRFVAAHEVGHTLGLRHNFGSSHATPVEKLRDKDYIAKYGHTPSIMDYARFNYVAQPEDGVTDLFPRIGVYDRWAIEWGYKPIFNTFSAQEDKKILNQWIISHEKDPMYWFGTEINSYDPRSQSEDLGNNAMLASEYGIKNLKRIIPNLVLWTQKEGEDYERLQEMYSNLVGQYRRYMGHVTKYIGGIYETPKTYDQAGIIYEPTPAALQRDAVSFLNKNLFETPEWMLDGNVLSRIQPGQGVDQLRAIQEATINSIFDYDRMQRLIETHAADNKAYSLDDLFTDLRKGIWSEVSSRKPINVYRRNLQKVWVEKMENLIKPGPQLSSPPRFSSRFFPASPPSPTANPVKSDVISLARGHLTALKAEISAALPGTGDKMTRYHLQDLLARINEILDPK